ncbi:MAG: phosphoribosylamine--glycine ligase, partial [Magnetococcales bacterium]|nr:phosphoribosylamine--glycine ligase [Magnetococcales bacterium]
PILIRMKSDILPLLEASASGSLADKTIEWDSRASLCVVMAAGGYPGSYEKGLEIKGLKKAAKVKDAVVFHAGTTLKSDKVVSSGGRVLGVTALGKTVSEAQSRAYEATNCIDWQDAYYRRDIGHRAIAREKNTNE